MAVVGTFLFAMKSIFVKLTFSLGADPTLVLTLRMLFSFPLYLGIWVYLRRLPERTSISRSNVVRSLVLGFLGYYLASYLDLSGLVLISAQMERLTLFTYPAIIAVLAWLFLGETLNPRIILSIAFCYVGIWLMYSQERGFSTDSDTLRGILLVVGAALSYSVYVLLAKPTMMTIGSREFTSLAMIGSTGFVLAHFLVARPVDGLWLVPSMVYVYVAILSVVCTVIPSFLINAAILRIGATRSSVIGSAGPVLTMLLAIVCLGEPSTPYHFVGLAIAIAGVSLVAQK